GLLAKDEAGKGDTTVARGPAAAAEPIRANFAETAFFQPQLLTAADGSAVIEFTVPDSVTAWNLWAHARTRDLRRRSAHKETRSIKDLMVRPYMPRFFREGDRAALKVVVNNASDKPMSGTLTLDVEDPDTGKSVANTFALSNTSRSFQ